MKIDVNLDALWACVNRMETENLAFDHSLDSPKGKQIALDDLESCQQLICLSGRQVSLFIPDHGPRMGEVIARGEMGKRFHVAHCRTLEEIKRNGRSERYHANANLDGEFEIHGDNALGRPDQGIARLTVCTDCLDLLNYRGVANANVSAAKRNEIVENFNIREFFSTYSSLFEYHAPTSDDEAKGYTPDWSDISRAARKEAGHMCQSCHVNLSSYGFLLHVHHRNGVRHDNAEANLAVLCADCYRRQPKHDHRHIRHMQMRTLNRVRRRQGIIPQASSWNDALKYADPALGGLLEHGRSKDFDAPEVAYEIINNEGHVTALELAWPKSKYGVYIDRDKPEAPAGWEVYPLEKAMHYFRQR